MKSPQRQSLEGQRICVSFEPIDTGRHAASDGSWATAERRVGVLLDHCQLVPDSRALLPVITGPD
jgi:hypothetical protein